MARRVRVLPVVFVLAAVATVMAQAPAVEWQAQASRVTGRLRGVSAVSSEVAWASGANGTVLRTTDGGRRWQVLPVPGAEQLDFRDVDAMSDSVAYALSIGAGETSRIYKTADGGAHWDLQFANKDPGIFLDAMAFSDAAHGIAFSDSVDGRFVILTTGNGGRTWERVPAVRLPPALPREGAFAASGTNVAMHGRHAWIGTTAARVLRSSDGGGTWKVATTPLATGPTAGIFSIAFRDRTARRRRRRRLPEGVAGARQRRNHIGWRRDLDARQGSRPLGFPLGRCLGARDGALADRDRTFGRGLVLGRRAHVDADSIRGLRHIQLRAGPRPGLGRRSGRPHRQTDTVCGYRARRQRVPPDGTTLTILGVNRRSNVSSILTASASSSTVS